MKHSASCIYVDNFESENYLYQNLKDKIRIVQIVRNEQKPRDIRSFRKHSK